MPARCSRDCTSRRRTGSACCTPTRIPGNYQLTADNRLAVIDFGSVARLPGGAPPIIGRVTRLALDGRAEDVLGGLREEGFIPAGYDPDPELLMDYLVPFIEPLRHETFHFTRTLDAGPGRADVELLQRRVEDGAPAQPAAGLPADPSGDVRLDRRAVPARRRRAVPRDRRSTPRGLRTTSEPAAAGHHHSWSRLASIDREMLPNAGRAHPARAAAVLLLDHPGRGPAPRCGRTPSRSPRSVTTVRLRGIVGAAEPSAPWDRRPGTSAPPRSAQRITGCGRGSGPRLVQDEGPAAPAGAVMLSSSDAVISVMRWFRWVTGCADDAACAGRGPAAPVPRRAGSALSGLEPDLR